MYINLTTFPLREPRATHVSLYEQVKAALRLKNYKLPPEIAIPLPIIPHQTRSGIAQFHPDLIPGTISRPGKTPRHPATKARTPTRL